MIVGGTVNARLEAMVRLRIRGPSGEVEVDALVDTGYTGSLALPATVAMSLSLKRLFGGTAVLADGSTRRFDTYGAEVEWGGVWRDIVASAVGDDALVGMGLLAGQELRIEVVAGGQVEVGPLPWEDDAS